MGLDLEYGEGQTPLDEDEKADLKDSTITSRGDLDEVEQLNIDSARVWIRNRKFTVEQILTEQFVRNLHERMFGDVWEWAGTFRKTNKNFGVDKNEIGVQIRMLLGNCSHWIEHKVYPEDEIAIRFSHRMVVIHPFPNGNGRHSRLIGDILIEKGLGKSRFSWGRNELVAVSEVRMRYLAALREADGGDFGALIEFARS